MSDAAISPPHIAVVTVSYGSGEVIAPFLQSVKEATSTTPLIVVADNLARSAGSVEKYVVSAGAVYVAMAKNAGYGGAVNAAVRALPDSVQWILISNPDVVLHAGSLDRLMEAADSDAAIGAVGPAILTPEGQIYPSAREVPSLGNGVGHALFANIWQSNPWTSAYRGVDPGAAQSRDAGWLSGACLLVRRHLFESLGGFDEGYFMYFEDVDLGWRIGRAGYRNVLETRAEVTHSGAHSTAKHSREMVRAHHASARRFLDIRYPGPRYLPVRAALRVGLWVRGRLVHGKLG